MAWTDAARAAAAQARKLHEKGAYFGHSRDSIATELKKARAWRNKLRESIASQTGAKKVVNAKAKNKAIREIVSRLMPSITFGKK